MTSIVVVVESLSRVQLFVTPCTVASQAPLSMEFPRQESWRGLPLPASGGLPAPGDQRLPPGGFFTPEPLGSPMLYSRSLCHRLLYLNLNMAPHKIAQ